MLKSLGLGGDGDEVEAIRDVEREFGVPLDPADAANWFTVGDVYSSLLKLMPANVKDDPSVWKRFCVAICRETGADSACVDERTKLLAAPLIEELKSWLKLKRGRDA